MWYQFWHDIETLSIPTPKRGSLKEGDLERTESWSLGKDLLEDNVYAAQCHTIATKGAKFGRLYHEAM
jgi:hypothetical protein